MKPKSTKGPKRFQTITWEMTEAFVMVVVKPYNLGVLAILNVNRLGVKKSDLSQLICQFSREDEQTAGIQLNFALVSLESYQLIEETATGFYFPTDRGLRVIENLKDMGTILSDGFKWSRDHAQPQRS